MSYVPKASTPLDLSKDRFLVRLLLVLLGLPIIILSLSRFDGSQNISLLDQVRASANFVESDEDGHLLSFVGKLKRVEFPIVFSEAITQSQKIRIDYTNSSNLRSLQLLIPEVSNRNNGYLHQARIIDGQSGSVIFGLNDTNARDISLVMYGVSRKAPIEIKISSLTISERTFIDSNLFFIILMLGVSSSLVLAGTITGSFLQKACRYDSRANGIFLFLGVFVYSLLLLLVLFIFQSLFPLHFSNYLLIFAVFITCILTARYLKSGFDLQKESWLARVKIPTILYLIITAIVAIIVGCIDGIALQEYYWSLIGKHRMFDGHRAHDNVFQYLNAVAIAENKPFNDLYKAPHFVRHLLFGVEDRQVLMGAILGTYRVLWGTLSNYAINTYGFFVIIGSSFSLLIIFPIYAFFRHYYKRYIVVMALCLLLMTTYVLGNIYYTWFKILGGGFILAGVYLLHFHKEHLKSWLIAGLFWGLAVNLHSGQAIIYPLLAIYFCYQHMKCCPSSSIMKSVAFTTVLTLTVILTMLPWEIIKHLYFPNTNVLLRHHFLCGEHFSGSMMQTIINFFDRYTLVEQLSMRSQQMLDGLRFNDIVDLYKNTDEWGVKDYFLNWNRLQFRYITIMVYPLLILLTFAMIAEKWSRHTWTEKSFVDVHRGPLNQVFMLSVACVIWGIVFMCTSSEAISSSFVSNFATLFILMFLHCSIAAYSRVGLILMLFYISLSFSKLYVYFSSIVDFSSLL